MCKLNEKGNVALSQGVNPDAKCDGHSVGECARDRCRLAKSARRPSVAARVAAGGGRAIRAAVVVTHRGRIPQLSALRAPTYFALR